MKNEKSITHKLATTILLTCVLTLTSLLSQAQCPVGDVVIRSQSDLERFITSYGSCTEIKGKMSILYDNKNSVVHVNGLESIKSITGDLYINSKVILTSLDGFQNLKAIGGGLTIASVGVKDLSGFRSLRTIKNDLYVHSNNLLESFDGLNNLESIGKVRLNVTGNPKLKSIAALSKLTTLPGLTITRNVSLQNLVGLQNVREIAHITKISENNSLSSLKGLEGLESILGGLEIDKNANLMSLEGANQIQQLKAYLSISNNSKLKNLNALKNARTFGYFLNISNNNLLDDISGLENVNAINIHNVSSQYEDINIENNPRLSNSSIRSICASLRDARTTTRISSNNVGSNSIIEVLRGCICDE